MVVVPLIVGLALMFLPQDRARYLADGVGLGTVMFVFIASIVLWLNWAPQSNGYAFLSTTPLGLEVLGARLQLGLNALSLPLFIATAFIGCAAGFCVYGSSVDRKGLLWSFILIILSGTLGAFASVDLFYAFLFHEIALLPTFLALLIFGGSGRKEALVQTGVFLLTGSFITLLGLINFYFQVGAHSFSILTIKEHLDAFGLGLSAEKHLPAWGMVFWGCVILSGLWPFYGWVPKLLTQAPTAVAMLYGGALKFFGLYFLLQGIMGWTFYGVQSFSTLLSWLCVLNILLIGFAALAQTDLRKLIAYIAVMHLGVLFLALNSYTRDALGGMVILIMGGGLTIALMLMLCGSLKRRLATVEMPQIGGLRGTTPRMATFLMLGFLSLMGLPGFANFWGEVAVLFGSMRGAPFAAPIILVGIAITTALAVRALRMILMGAPKPGAVADLTTVEHFSAWILILPVIFFGVLPGVLTGPMNRALENVIRIVF